MSIIEQNINKLMIASCIDVYYNTFQHENQHHVH